MTSPTTFFNVFAQITATLLSILIAIALVAHQLDEREKRKRTEILRQDLTKIKNKYGKVLYTAMEMVQQPFVDVPSSEIDDIKDDNPSEIVYRDDIKFNNHPVANRIWILSFKIDQILEEISPDEDIRKDNLLSKAQLRQLSVCADYINNNIKSGSDNLRIEIGEELNERVHIRDKIFEQDDIIYQDLGEWYSIHYDKKAQQSDLDGKTILSLSKLFNELSGDIEKVNMHSENTVLCDNKSIKAMFWPSVMTFMFGITLPVLFFIPSPFEILVLDGVYLVVYQYLLLTVTLLSISHLFNTLWSEI
jgi:hypothetical protein